MVLAVNKLMPAVGPAQAEAACWRRGCCKCCTAGLHCWVELALGCRCRWLALSQLEALHSRFCPE